jgi:hypothetical protein
MTCFGGTHDDGAWQTATTCVLHEWALQPCHHENSLPEFRKPHLPRPTHPTQCRCDGPAYTPIRGMGMQRTWTAWLHAYFMHPARVIWLLMKSRFTQRRSGHPSSELNHSVATAVRASLGMVGERSNRRKTNRTNASVA